MMPPLVTDLIESVALWLADFYLAGTILLVAAGVLFAVVKQPVRRMAVAWGTLLGLLLAAFLCPSTARPRFDLRPLLAHRGDEAPQAEKSQAPRPPIPNATAPVPFVDRKPVDPRPAPVEQSAQVVLAAIESAAEIQHAADHRQLAVEAIVFCFLSGALLIGAWLLVGVVRASRLVQQSMLASPTCLDQLSSIVGSTSRAPRLRINRSLLTPVATGALWPVILLPDEFERSDRRQELNAVLAHEWAHIKNGDLWLLAVDRVVSAVLWPHPLYWWMRRRMRADQELLADAAAASQVGATDYAALLVEWARNMAGRRSLGASSAVGIWERPGGLEQRVTALIHRSNPTILHTSGRARIGVAAAMTTVGLFAASFSVRPPRADLAQAQAVPQPSRRISTDSSQPANAAEEPPGFHDVAGTCRDKNGKRLAGVQVSLYAMQDATGRHDLLRQGTTDNEGRFIFRKGLPKGIVQMSWNIADADGAAFVFIAAKRGLATGVKVLRGEGQPIEFTLEKAASLSGKVRDRQGKPIAGAWVHVAYYPLPKTACLAAQSDAHGDFAIADLADYQFTGENGSGPPLGLLQVDHPDYGGTKVPYKRVPGHVDAVLGKAAAIAGTVLVAETGKPAAGIFVFATPVEEPFPAAASPLPWATTDREGRYQLRPLPEGRFNVCASLNPPGRATLEPRDSGLTAAAIKSLPTREGECAVAPPLRLIKGGLVTGRLVEYRAGVNGVRDPVRLEKGQTLQVIAFHGPELPGPGVVAEITWVKQDGTFRLRLPPGLHYLYLPNDPRPDGTYPFPVSDMHEPCTEEDAAHPISGLHKLKVQDGKIAEIEISVYRPAAANSFKPRW